MVCFVRTPGQARSWRSNAARPAFCAMRFSSRATTTRCRIWFRCCRVRRNWNCSWKSWTTRFPSGSRRSIIKTTGAGCPTARAYKPSQLLIVILNVGSVTNALGTCSRPRFAPVPTLRVGTQVRPLCGSNSPMPSPCPIRAAERRERRSHAERGNERPPMSWPNPTI